MPNIQFVSERKQYSIVFSICTIVNDMEEYKQMKESFETCGFTDGCEYLVADNTERNIFNAYTAMAAFIKQSTGRFILAVHQDVRCIDSKEMLMNYLEIINSMDNKWALCGNAGCNGFHEKRIHLINNGNKITYTNLPALVNSLDENFIVINADTNISVSADLDGFHLYGTDLCCVADFLGYSSYVIPFMVNHLSKGNLETLDKFIPQFTKTYGRKLRSRYMETTCTRFFMASGVLNSKVTNMWPLIFFIKAGQRIKQVIRLIKEGDKFKKTVVPV